MVPPMQIHRHTNASTSIIKAGLPDPPPQCVGSMDQQIPYVSGSDLPRIHHGNGSLAKGNVSWSHEMDPMKNNKKYPEIFKQIM